MFGADGAPGRITSPAEGWFNEIFSVPREGYWMLRIKGRTRSGPKLEYRLYVAGGEAAYEGGGAFDRWYMLASEAIYVHPSHQIRLWWRAFNGGSDGWPGGWGPEIGVNPNEHPQLHGVFVPTPSYPGA